MRHGVRQAVLELSLREQSVAALDAYRQFFERQVQPALAKSLDELAAPDQDQHIERLEIDLGTIDLDSARSDWRGKITKALSHALSQSAVATDQRVMGEEIEGQGTSAGQARRVDLILYFLRRGLLPWYESRPFVQLEREFQSDREFASEMLSPVQLSAIEQILGDSRSRVRLLRALLPATRAWILRTFIAARLKEFANIDSPPWDAKAQAEILQQWIFRSGLPERDLQKIASAEWWAKSLQRISALQDAAPTEVSLRLQQGLQEIAISDHAAESTHEAPRNETELH
ncbi:MAG: contractile injection system tape measure protein, partial [Proteobacteria bacterium]|nr:contractile injection system tape measure protein [Pseudomonadota bacterium]